MIRFYISLFFIIFSFYNFFSCSPYSPPKSHTPTTAFQKWKSAKKLFKGCSDPNYCQSDYSKAMLFAMNADYSMKFNPVRLSKIKSFAQQSGYKLILNFIKSISEDPHINNNKTKQIKINIQLNDGKLTKNLSSKPSDIVLIFKKLMKSKQIPSLQKSTWKQIFVLSCIYTGSINTSRLFDKIKYELSHKTSLEILGLTSKICPSLLQHNINFFNLSELIDTALNYGLILPTSVYDPNQIKTFSDLKYLYLLAGDSVLRQKFTNFRFESLRLKLTRNISKAVHFLKKQKIPKTFKERIDAANLAIEFEDLPAALKHLRWAAGIITDKNQKTEILLQLDSIMRLSNEPGRIDIIKEALLLNYSETLRYLFNNLYYPSIVLLTKHTQQNEIIQKAKAKLAYYKTLPNSQFKTAIFNYWTKLHTKKQIDNVLKSIKLKVIQSIPPKIVHQSNIKTGFKQIVYPFYRKSSKKIRSNNDFFYVLDNLLKQKPTPKEWLAFMGYYSPNPYISMVSILIEHIYPQHPAYLAVACQGFAMANKPEKSKLIISKMIKLLPDRTLMYLWASKMFLHYGFNDVSSEYLLKFIESTDYFPHKKEAKYPNFRLFQYILILKHYQKTKETKQFTNIILKLLTTNNQYLNISTAKILYEIGFRHQLIEKTLKQSKIPFIYVDLYSKNPQVLILLQFLFPFNPIIYHLKSKVNFHQILKKGISKVIKPDIRIKKLLCKIKTKQLDCFNSNIFYNTQLIKILGYDFSKIW